MISIIYISQQTTSFNVKAMAAKAQKKNSQLGITGYLYQDKNYFVQFIEGEEDVVLGLFEEIKADTRHKIISHFQINLGVRVFPNWSMHQLLYDPEDEINLEYLLESALIESNKPNYDLEFMIKNIEKIVTKIAKKHYENIKLTRKT